MKLLNIDGLQTAGYGGNSGEFSKVPREREISVYRQTKVTYEVVKLPENSKTAIITPIQRN